MFLKSLSSVSFLGEVLFPSFLLPHLYPPSLKEAQRMKKLRDLAAGHKKNISVMGVVKHHNGFPRKMLRPHLWGFSELDGTKS